MASSKLDEKQHLEAVRTKIESFSLIRSKADKIGVDADYILNPSSGWKKLKSFSRINEDRRQLFKKKLNSPEQPMILETAGPRGNGTDLGLVWEKLLSCYIANKRMEEKDRQVCDALVEALKNLYPGLELLAAYFPLYGYMWDNSGKVYLWEGETNAVGYHNGEYVIVEWKVLDILNYWSKEAEISYGAHFHQGLIYAMLLQMQLQLSYRPKVLLVPIHSLTGNQMHPGLFTDIPKQTKTTLSNYNWSVETPRVEPRFHSPTKSIFKTGIQVGAVSPDTSLKDLFRPEATVADLLKQIHYLKLEEKEI